MVDMLVTAAVVGMLIVIAVVEVIEATVAPSGMPTPATPMPTTRSAVVVRLVIALLPLVLVTARGASPKVRFELIVGAVAPLMIRPPLLIRKTSVGSKDEMLPADRRA